MRGLKTLFFASFAFFEIFLGNTHAIPISGELSLDGFDNLTATTITFLGGSPISNLGESGDFAVLGNGAVPVFRNIGTPIPFGSLTTGSNLSCGGGCIYTVSSGSITSTFNLVTEQPPVISAGFVDITGTGTLTLTGFDPTPGNFFLSAQGGIGDNLTFSSTSLAVPGPVLGAGFPGIAAAAGIMAVLARRRRTKFTM